MAKHFPFWIQSIRPIQAWLARLCRNSFGKPTAYSIYSHRTVETNPIPKLRLLHPQFQIWRLRAKSCWPFYPMALQCFWRSLVAFNWSSEGNKIQIPDAKPIQNKWAFMITSLVGLLGVPAGLTWVKGHSFQSPNCLRILPLSHLTSLRWTKEGLLVKVSFAAFLGEKSMTFPKHEQIRSVMQPS